MRVVLDTDVVVAALRSDRGASRQLLLATLGKRITILLSVPLILQYEAVLTRPEQLRERALTAADVNALLDALVSISEPVGLHFLWRPQLKDPADEMVLETAVNGRADRLATFNVRHLREPAVRFAIQAAEPGWIVREI
jgi:putative PIN family toxin of toxin-antitoxin system